MENNIRVYEPNEKVKRILNQIEGIKSRYNVELTFDNTTPNKYKILYNGRTTKGMVGQFTTYNDVIYSLTMVETILEDKELMREEFSN